MLRYGLNDGWMRSFAHMWPDDYRTARKPCHTSKPNPSTSVLCCTASAAPHRGTRVWMPLTTVSTWSVWWLLITFVSRYQAQAISCCWKLRARLLCLFCWLLTALAGGRCQGSLWWHSSIWAEFAEELAKRHLGVVLHCQCRTAPRYHMVGSGWHSEFWIVFQHVHSVSLLQVGHSLSAGSSWRQRSGSCWRFHQCVCQQVPRVSRMSWWHQDKKKSFSPGTRMSSKQLYKFYFPCVHCYATWRLRSKEDQPFWQFLLGMSFHQSLYDSDGMGLLCSAPEYRKITTTVTTVYIIYNILYNIYYHFRSISNHADILWEYNVLSMDPYVFNRLLRPRWFQRTRHGHPELWLGRGGGSCLQDLRSASRGLRSVLHPVVSLQFPQWRLIQWQWSVSRKIRHLSRLRSEGTQGARCGKNCPFWIQCNSGAWVWCLAHVVSPWLWLAVWCLPGQIFWKTGSTL